MIIQTLTDLSLQIVILHWQYVFHRFWWKKRNFKLPVRISNRLLECLSDQENGLPNEYLQWFTYDKCVLNVVKLCLKNLNNPSSLNYLRKHKIQKLELSGLSFFNLKDCLYFFDSHFLTSLSIQGYHRKENDSTEKIYQNAMHICRFKKILNLNIRCTPFSNKELNLIVQEIPYLEKLDISNTEITSCKYLSNVKSLKILICAGMRSDCKINISHLPLLEYLDVSCNKSLTIAPIFQGKFPNLKYLDMFGLDFNHRLQTR